MNEKCYTLKKYIYNNSIFSNTIDATYIINLENNGRLPSIMNQLLTYQPTNIVYIVFNKGYKKCKKEKFINLPPIDLVDAFINIFKHAQLMNYNNILILEDDFIFSKEILNKKHINNINNFLNKKNNKEFIYLLGCCPVFMIPYDYNNYKYIISIGTHSVIYSKKFREKILKIDQKKISDWDDYNNKLLNRRYCYYKPLCYQLFTDTDNSKNWSVHYKILKPLEKYIIFLIKYIFKLLELDKKHEPGFSYLYIFAKYFWLIIILFFIYLFIKLTKKKI